MSEKNPPKRLVSKGQYVWVMGKKAGLYSLSGLAFVLGLLGFGTAVFRFTLLLAHGFGKAVIFQLSDLIYLIPILGSAALYLSSKLLIKKANAVEQVDPITDRTAYLLPLEETLVRGSDLPPIEQQAELLRAVQTEQETPQEELLRASQRSDKE
ncbi:MAG TPA: hypothetical protein VKU00_21600 [Chthonomonadaceae bacterium]|nr:hypothetical protein [Chthonomonadaceae bacterium]